MLKSALVNVVMGDLLDHSISVDPIRLFKTSPESYALVQQHIPLEKQAVVFISSNGWDALSKTWFGFTFLRMNRRGLRMKPSIPRRLIQTVLYLEFVKFLN